MMMMRRTEYLLPDYDDTAPCHGYTNEIDVRDSISEFPHEYKMDGHDSNFENMNHNMPHSSGKFDSPKASIFYQLNALIVQFAVDADNIIPKQMTPEVLQALRGVRFIAQHIKDADKDNEVISKIFPFNKCDIKHSAPWFISS